MAFTKYAGGWRPDAPDYRDDLFLAEAVALPPQFSLVDKMPPIDDQNGYGACVAHSTEAALRYEHNKQGLGDIQFSRAFIYYMARTIDGDPSSDSGTSNRAGAKSVARYGACPEAEWAYTESHIYMRPAAQQMSDARMDRVLRYQRVSRNLNNMKQAIFRFPMIYGISVYESFETDEVTNTGIIPMPTRRREQLLGGHSMLAVGWDDSKQWFIVRNSWGVNWGSRELPGHGFLPYQYLMNRGLSADFWILTLAQ